MKYWRWIPFLLVAQFLIACQSKASRPQISVEEAWGQPSPAVATSGAFYMTIHNTGNVPDALISVTSDVCGVIELHETYMKDDGAAGMRMIPDGVIEIPAGKTVEFKVGGMHMMCINKMANFAIGDKYELNLSFERAGEMTVEVEIREP